MGKDFSTADKGKTFKRGGDMAKANPFMEMIAKKKDMAKGKMAAFEKSGKDVEKKGMKEGSKADMAMDKKQMAGMKKGGMAKKMASGGSASKRADGVAQKGKTKGKMLNKGGMTR